MLLPFNGFMLHIDSLIYFEAPMFEIKNRNENFVFLNGNYNLSILRKRL